MAQLPSIDQRWQLVLPEGLYTRLHHHLFPGDGDEHGAIITAGLAETARGVRLLVRDLHLAVDGVNYVPGKRGYRMLKAAFISHSAPRKLRIQRIFSASLLAVERP